MKDILDTPAIPAKRTRNANPRAVSVRIQARNMSKAKGTRAHDFRVGKSPKYVCEERTKLNRELMKMRSLNQIRNENVALRNKAGRQRAMKSNAAVIVAGIITFGHEAAEMFETLSPDVQNAAFRELSQVLADDLGTQLESLVVHLDETTIHAHFTLRGYTDDGHAVSAVTKAGTTARLQDRAAEVMQRYHPGIERGHRKRDRLAAGADFADTIHRSVRELHQDLPLELEALKRDKEARQAALAELEASAAKTQKHLDKLAAKAALSEKEEKRRQTYEARLQKKEAEIEATQSALEESMRAVAAEKEAAHVEASRLDALKDDLTLKKAEVEKEQDQVQTAVREVKEREEKVEQSVAAIDSLVAEIDEGTMYVKEDGKITFKNTAPISAAPTDLRARLMPAVFRLVQKIDATEKRAAWLETMMGRVKKLLRRADLKPEVRQEAADVTRDWEA